MCTNTPPILTAHRAIDIISVDMKFRHITANACYFESAKFKENKKWP